MGQLEKASRSFLWFYRNIKSKRRLMGYHISYDGKYRIHLIFQGLGVEVRAPWIQDLGKMIHKHYDFEQPLHISYDDVMNDTFGDVVENS